MDGLQTFPWAAFACRCGKCHTLAIDLRLCAAWLELRALADGHGHLRMTSGYRCPAHNAATPGASANSTHTRGQAIDFAIDGLPAVEAFRMAEAVPILEANAIGVYPDRGFVHVDLRGTRYRFAYLRGIAVPFSQVIPGN